MAGEWAIGNRDKWGRNITGELNVKDLECCAQKFEFYSLDIPGYKHLQLTIEQCSKGTNFPHSEKSV